MTQLPSIKDHDTEILIKQDENQNLSTSVGFYIISRFIPIMLCFYLSFLRFNFALSFLILVGVGLLEFYLTKNYFGYGLVGLKWFFNTTDAPQFPFIVFFSRPFPFVASTVDSNVFWLGLFVGSALWVICTVVSTILGGTNWLFLCVILQLMSLFNFWGFMKCHNIAKLKVEDATRTMLLDTSVSFQAANEIAGGDASASSSSSNDVNSENSENDNDNQKDEESSNQDNT